MPAYPYSYPEKTCFCRNLWFLLVPFERLDYNFTKLNQQFVLKKGVMMYPYPKEENTMNQTEIGIFIARCRKEQKLTQAQLAEKLNITDRAVSKWETGVSHS